MNSLFNDFVDDDDKNLFGLIVCELFLVLLLDGQFEVALVIVILLLFLVFILLVGYEGGSVTLKILIFSHLGDLGVLYRKSLR